MPSRLPSISSRISIRFFKLSPSGVFFFFLGCNLNKYCVYFQLHEERFLEASLLGGFYVAQTISLSFGALGVNDVIAALVCVLLTEYVTRFYYSRPKVTFPIALLNNFKMGFTYGLFIDAFKLAS